MMSELPSGKLDKIGSVVVTPESNPIKITIEWAKENTSVIIKLFEERENEEKKVFSEASIFFNGNFLEANGYRVIGGSNSSFRLTQDNPQISLEEAVEDLAYHLSTPLQLKYLKSTSNIIEIQLKNQGIKYTKGLDKDGELVILKISKKNDTKGKYIRLCLINGKISYQYIDGEKLITVINRKTNIENIINWLSD